MARREIFAGNWKMYKNHEDALSFLKDLANGIKKTGVREYLLFVPSPFARDAANEAKASQIDIGMQNMYFEDEGAFTGEVSPLMVKDAGIENILIGHSERRHVFSETDEEVNKKVKAALKHNLKPMICIGELLEDREAGKTIEVVKKQLIGAYKDLSAEEAQKTVLAYEPVWAIGTGKVATPEIAEEIHQEIRKIVKELYSDSVADAMPILYGGSVKPDNIAGLYEKENIDGVLVGGASLKADLFLPIVNV
jgi:triosephosphate isomerase